MVLEWVYKDSEVGAHTRETMGSDHMPFFGS